MSISTYLASRAGKEVLLKKTNKSFAFAYSLFFQSFILLSFHLNFLFSFHRMGTNVDSENLSNTLRNLHFDVAIFKDCKYNDIVSEISSGEYNGNYCKIK